MPNNLFIWIAEEASLSITKEFEMESADEDNEMFSICTYIADNDDALNLVEGERVYVIGMKEIK